ncbi:hypothetical protein FRC08_016311, partial [Ceratobasidium sp. 394]
TWYELLRMAGRDSTAQNTRPPNAIQPHNWFLAAMEMTPVLVHLTTAVQNQV